MADGNFDNTNRGVIFQPHPEQKFNGQGNINVNGVEHRCVMVNEPLKRGGEPVNVVYVRLGPLFKNDKGGDNAPTLSGPMDMYPDKRMAAWLKTKDNRKFYSLSVSDKQPPQDGGGQQQGQQQGQTQGGGWGDDDEIPF